MNVIPPDVGTAHQMKLECTSQVVQERDGLLFPDSVVGTDSHTTMINGLGILGWGEEHSTILYLSVYINSPCGLVNIMALFAHKHSYVVYIIPKEMAYGMDLSGVCII